MTRPRSLQQLLGLGESARLIERIQYLKSLNGQLHICLDPETSSHAQVADLNAERLLVHVDSSAWATRLRYQLPQLLRCLHRHPSLAQLRRIEVRVAPQAQPVSPPPQAASLSAANAAIIDSTADGLSDPALRSALKRLARRARNKQAD
jgi:hypothetical protein